MPNTPCSSYAFLIAFACLLNPGCAGRPQSDAAAGSSVSSAKTTTATSIQLPDGEGGIGFDDLRYSQKLGRVLVPAGRTGKLDLIEPASEKIEVISGFSEQEKFGGGHGEGTTSVDEGGDFLFAIDRTTKELVVVDPNAKTILARARLSGSPDYVRFVAPTHEVWVTEPDAESIEVFSLPSDGHQPPRSETTIAVKGGPESFVVDVTRGRAYTHLWESTTLAIDLKSRAIVARWPNGCAGSRGIALDEQRGFLFVGCAEGKAIVLDVAHDGKELSSADVGSGIDIIDYDPRSGHLFFPAASSGTFSILQVGNTGMLTLLSTFPIPKGCHSVVTDGNGRAFVGDPRSGQVLVIRDSLSSSSR
jgi:DNA-binding beta-propeller fold protein YncE